MTLFDLIALAPLTTPLDDVLPPATPTLIPGTEGAVKKFIGYGLFLLTLAGAGGIAFGGYKFATSDKSRPGAGMEGVKYMAGGIGAVLISGSVLTIVNSLAAGE
ncbi:hypothetical protein ACN20G_31715 (plasmid) [Streptomyces sp. BI20]|uniref:hypothetical protein n=1 Tax=Streptomyces sp. BI20 TaxID=3403460 RepID=UPI003C7308D4